MWSVAIYSFRLTAAQFYRLTPRQYSLLNKRHREAMAHAEMVSAFTTSAVYNTGYAQPEKPISPLEFMPSHQQHADAMKREMTEEELAAESAFNVAVLREKLRQQAALKETQNG